MTTERQGGSGGGVRWVEVAGEAAGQRIDNFLLRTLKGVPRGLIYRLLRKGQVRVNSGRVKPDYRVRAGDKVRIPPVRTGEGARPAPQGPGQRLEGRILFEDDRLLILDKPAGMAVHGGSGLSWGVIEALRAARPEARFLELVHRLDRDTSGCLMLAKRRSALRAMHELLRGGQVDKRYLALLRGPWTGGERRVEAPLEKFVLRGGERQVRVSGAGKPARTLFRPLDDYGQAVLAEVVLDTGRTHQIRVHAAHIGHPLAGDEKYGDPDFDRAMRALGLRRLFLHAHSLAFAHPATGEPVHVSAPLDDELKAVLVRLENSQAQS